MGSFASKKKTQIPENDADVSLDKFSSDRDLKQPEVIVEKKSIPIKSSKYGESETPKDLTTDIDDLITDLGISNSSSNKEIAVTPKMGTQNQHGAKLIFSSAELHTTASDSPGGPLSKKPTSPLHDELHGRGDVTLDVFRNTIVKLCAGAKNVMIPTEKLFHILDKDCDQILNQNELAVALRVMGDPKCPPGEQGAFLLEAFDSNGDGFLTTEEISFALYLHVRKTIDSFEELFDFVRVESEVFQEAITIATLKQAIDASPTNQGIKLYPAFGGGVHVEFVSDVGSVRVTLDQQRLTVGTAEIVGKNIESCVYPALLECLHVGMDSPKHKISDLVPPLVEAGFCRWIQPLSMQANQKSLELDECINENVLGFL